MVAKDINKNYVIVSNVEQSLDGPLDEAIMYLKQLDADCVGKYTNLRLDYECDYECQTLRLIGDRVQPTPPNKDTMMKLAKDLRIGDDLLMDVLQDGTMQYVRVKNTSRTGCATVNVQFDVRLFGADAPSNMILPENEYVVVIKKDSGGAVARRKKKK
jgi:hypothetical protein